MYYIGNSGAYYDAMVYASLYLIGMYNRSDSSVTGFYVSVLQIWFTLGMVYQESDFFFCCRCMHTLDLLALYPMIWLGTGMH